MAAEMLSVLDNRTGKSYEVPVVDGAIRATELRQIRTGPDDPGLLSYDPAFMNTASTRSAITFLDGNAGHPPRRPRAELLRERGSRGRIFRRRSVFGGGSRRGRPLRPASRRRQRGGPQDAEDDRLGSQRSRVHPPGEAGRDETDGVRPSRIQEP